MSQITKIEMWKDTGFQEGAIEVPSVNDILPELTSSTDNYIKIAYDGGIRTSTADFFSGFTIPEAFADYMSYSYVRVTYEYNNSDDPMIFYGWIDDIALKSDTDNNPSVYVSWHIDYWRTYLGSAKLGYGMIQSRPSSLTDPPQSCSYRYRLPGDYTPMGFTGVGKEANWLIINHTRETDNNKLTEVRSAVIPISKDANVHFYYKNGDSTVKCPSLGDVITGLYDESLKMSPSAISSVFLSPVPPLAIQSGTGTQTDPYILDQGSSESTTDYKRISLSLAEKLISSVELLKNYQFRISYTDGSVYTSYNFATQTWEAFWRGIITRLTMNQGRYNNTSYKYGNNRTMSIRCTENGSSVTSMVARWIKLDDLVNEARSGQFEDDFVIGDKVAFTSSNVYSVPSEPTITVTHTTSDTPYIGNYDYIDVNYSHGAKTNVSGTTFTYDGSTFGNVWILVDDIETISLAYDQKVTSLKYQVEVSTNGYAYSKNQNYYEYSQTLPQSIQTTDTREWVFTDMSGIPIGTLPWGIECKDYTVRNVITSSSAYLEYRFNGIDSHTLGTSFVVPLPSVDLTSNSWSDYVYSGQRDYDISQRKIAANQALVGSITSSLTGATSNAIMGGIGGISKESWENYVLSQATQFNTATNEIASQATNKTTRAYAGGYSTGASHFQSQLLGANPPAVSFGAGKALGASLGVGLATAGVEYLATQYFNGQLQKAEDMLQAKQIDSILMAGNGWDWLWNGRSCGFISMVPDNYSLDRFREDKRLNGIYCSEPVEDCDYVRTSEGPYRISELIVSGSIPVQARAHIKGRFANGVRIRTINTETVTEGD